MAGNQVPYNQLTAPENKYGTDGSNLPSYQRDFIQQFAPYAMLASSQTGIPARFLLAEASIETDWGRSGSATKFNNIFGIKASAGQIAAGAQVAYMPTREFINGQSVMVNSPFMVYKSPEDGFNAFTEKLQKTKWPDQRALLNYRSADPFAEDGKVEKDISDAFGRSSYLTMEKINQGMLDRMARMPSDLRAAGFNTAVDFNKASNDLAGLVGYKSGGYPDVSNGLDNDGLGTLGLNGFTFNRTPSNDSTLDYLSNQLTGGLREAGSKIAEAYGNVTGRLPSVGELKSRVDDVASGARTLFDQLSDIGSSAEAKSFSQATGFDPNQYVVNDIYRLGLGRDVDAGSLGQQMDVLRNQGGQSLYNQVANSQEGRTYALNNYYGSVFGHEADTPGMNYWLGQLAAGKTMPAVQTEILASPEAQALAPSVREQLASLITPSFMTPTLGFTGSQVSPIGPGSTQYPLGPGSTTYPLGPGSTTYPVGPAGYETSPVGPGPTQYPVGPGGTTNPVGPGGFEVSPVGPGPTHYPVGPDGYEVGTVPPPALSPEIRNYYETYLHRAPDAQGAIEYQGQLDRGVSPSIVEAQILSAPEAVQALTPEEMASRTSAYQAKYGLLPEEAKTLAPLASDFARVLGRPADSKTIQWWDQQIDAGTPFAGLEAQILTAPETQAVGAPALTQAVQDFQTQYALKPEEVMALGPLASEFGRVLDRPADIPTMQAWDAQLDAGATMPQLTAQFLMAPEVQARTGGRGDAFDSFQGQYGRSASDYLAALNNGFGFTGSNVSGGVGPGSWHGSFNAADYLAANPDVAAAKMNPWDHYSRFGYGEGRAIDTAGDRLPQGFDGTAYLAANPDVARAGMNPFEHFARYGAGEGRQMPTLGSYGFSGADVSQGLGPVGPGTWNGKFNAADYLAANKDVASSGMNAEDHYLRYGFGEGRSLDLAGHKIHQGFDPTAYLNNNQDVKAAGMDPLRHYIDSGAAEGRAAPTGGNPYQFSNYNFAQGAGPTGNGAFGIGGITSSAPGGMGSAPSQSSSAPLPAFGSNLNVSGGVGNGSFGLGGFAQTDAPPGGFEASWESGSQGALPGSGGAGGSAWEYTDRTTGEKKTATFDPQKSENAYLAGQVAQNQSQIEAGRSPFANNPNNWNASFQQQNAIMQAQNFYTPTPFATAAPATYALPAPGPGLPLPTPVMNQGLGVNPYGGFGLISTF